MNTCGARVGEQLEVQEALHLRLARERCRVRRTGKGDEDSAASPDELCAELSVRLVVVERHARRPCEQQEHAGTKLRPVGDQHRDARAGPDAVLLQGDANQQAPAVWGVVGFFVLSGLGCRVLRVWGLGFSF